MAQNQKGKQYNVLFTLSEENKTPRTKLPAIQKTFEQTRWEDRMLEKQAQVSKRNWRIEVTIFTNNKWGEQETAVWFDFESRF